ncbi:sulfate/molybdate ABC transporter ATP-binding protein [Dyadobacter sp. CY323]|uniref:sulfate/molybdate ABC transporter ATP-binding protein n=1 Tax=Dyadobacter sp. CY323 TaxID=2907302 RepID=UPI001F2C8A92|nr:ATP-binding cassette domain-containing protein [Dyadobacter sp. CY323]MCE6992209.1 ATP-binding cassette domain-containing protein [Dyadobacter sp. CY323]
MSDNLLEIQIRHSLETANGKQAMEISLALEEKKITALTGPSGAGKTTLLKQIAGLMMPESGKISFRNVVWLDTEHKIRLPSQVRNIGFVFQDYALFPHMTVRENLHYALPKNGDETVIDQLLESVGLLQLGNRKPYQLSGGQQQRVALARALVRKPDLLLLDEPFNALDHAMRFQLQDLLLKFQREYQFSVIMVTHDIGEMFRMSDQVLIMENGKILQSGKPSDVYLNEQSGNDGILMYGKVLTCRQEEDVLIIDALIDNKIRKLKLPIHMHQKLDIGAHFTLHYSLDSPVLQIISKA